MSTARQGVAGATRTCPHCRATILESASVCPACRHHLRFEVGAAKGARPSFTALRVDGTLRPPPDSDAWEYSLLLTIANDRGEEIARQVVGVGALQAEEQRTFTLSVEVFTPHGTVPGQGSGR